MSEAENKIADNSPESRRAGRRSTMIAVVALLISIVALVQFWVPRLDPRLSADQGGPYLTFIGPNNDRIGHILDDYSNGFILRRVDPKRARRIEMMVGDKGVSIVLYKNESPVARWSLTDDAEKFEKLSP